MTTCVAFRFFKSNLLTNPSDDSSEQKFYKEITEGKVLSFDTLVEIKKKHTNNTQSLHNFVF